MEARFRVQIRIRFALGHRSRRFGLVDRSSDAIQSPCRERLIIRLFAAVNDLAVELLCGFKIAQSLGDAPLPVDGCGREDGIFRLAGEIAKGRRCRGQVLATVVKPCEPPHGVVAQLAVGKLLLNIAVRLDRVVFAAEILVNIGGGILRSVSISAGRKFFQDRFEIFESRAVVMAVPKNLADLIQRFRRFRTVGIFARDLLEHRDRFVSTARREIEVGQFGQVAQAQALAQWRYSEVFYRGFPRHCSAVREPSGRLPRREIEEFGRERDRDTFRAAALGLCAPMPSSVNWAMRHAILDTGSWPSLDCLALLEPALADKALRRGFRAWRSDRRADGAKLRLPAKIFARRYRS